MNVKSRKNKESESASAALRLHGIVKPGTTVYTVLRHVARSGMSRVVDAFVMTGNGPQPVGFLFARLLGWRWDGTRGGVWVSGCGMDAGMELVYAASSALYKAGFGCTGDKCPSNDHSNGDRDYRPHEDDTPKSTEEVGTDIPRLRAYRHWHRDGGYALRQVWA